MLSLDGQSLAGAELDVWQNGADELYAVQDPEAPEHHLRGRFLTREDGSFGFVAVRPTPYPIPADGPVGHMLAASGRHPNRPAHLHVIVRAPATARWRPTYSTAPAPIWTPTPCSPSSRHWCAASSAVIAEDPDRPDGVSRDVVVAGERLRTRPLRGRREPGWPRQ